MVSVNTQRYQIDVKEIGKGGPGGYESKYLTDEGHPASERLYSILDNFKGVSLASSNRMIRQRNEESLIKTLEGNLHTGIASGFKPSGAYHFGHKLTSSTVSFFQKNGIQIFIPIADLECMLDSKLSKEDYRYWTADNLLDWGANGVDLDAARVYLQSEEYRVSNLAYLLARGLTFDLPIDIYGFNKMSKEFSFLFAGITQVGDIVLPQHDDFGNNHSFMVSGQDQDGHMKMTLELIKRALESKTELSGVSNLPSGFYVPHIRGIVGKASSSKPEFTIYLGSGPKKLNLTDRVESSLSKLINAQKNPSLAENLQYGALDMIRYLECFNEHSAVKFENISREIMGTKSNQEVDQGLIKESLSHNQKNLDIVMESLPIILKEHQEKRMNVLEYAIANVENKENAHLIKPTFWEVPEGVIVKGTKNPTQWFNLVYAQRNNLIP